MHITKLAIGQLVTAAKIAAMPVAAPNDAEKPIICENTPPEVAPINSEGTISPPLKPDATVTAVKIILSRNAAG